MADTQGAPKPTVIMIHETFADTGEPVSRHETTQHGWQSASVGCAALRARWGGRVKPIPNGVEFRSVNPATLCRERVRFVESAARTALAKAEDV